MDDLERKLGVLEQRVMASEPYPQPSSYAKAAYALAQEAKDLCQQHATDLPLQVRALKVEFDHK